MKCLITCTIGDHIFGIGPLIAACLNGAGGMIDGVPDSRLNQQPEDITVRILTTMMNLPVEAYMNI